MITKHLLTFQILTSGSAKAIAKLSKFILAFKKLSHKLDIHILILFIVSIELLGYLPLASLLD
jgi:hypothetical protein